MLSNDEFTHMMRDYDDVDHKIVCIEAGGGSLGSVLRGAQKPRLRLKDKLYRMIVAAEH